MTDDLDLGLKQALRAEGFRMPVTLAGAELLDRVQREQRTRTRRLGLFGTFAAATAVLVVFATSLTFLPRPITSSQGGSPSAGCQESTATTHMTWWYEMGGPRAYFNIEPGTRTAESSGATWLLIVRVDPGPRSPEALEIWATADGSSDRIVGTLNSQLSSDFIGRFHEQAPELGGDWFLFELPIHAAGCWQIDAAVDREVVGSATVDVGPPGPDASGANAAPVNVVGTATWCGVIGGCGYFLEIEGEGRHDRVRLGAYLSDGSLDGGPFETRKYNLELDNPVAPLDPGTYRATLSLIGYSDAITGGEPSREFTLATCTTTFIVAAGTNGVVIRATFSATECSASAQFVVLADEPSYELDCGPIEPRECRTRADRAVENALLHRPEAHVKAFTFTSQDGDYTLEFDDGQGIRLTVN